MHRLALAFLRIQLERLGTDDGFAILGDDTERNDFRNECCVEVRHVLYSTDEHEPFAYERVQASEGVQRLAFVDLLTMRTLVTYTTNEMDIIHHLCITDIVDEVRVTNELHETCMLGHVPSVGQIDQLNPVLQCFAGTDDGLLWSYQLEVLRFAAMGV